MNDSELLFIRQTGPFLLRHFECLVTVLATKDFQPEGFYLCFSKFQFSILYFLQQLVRYYYFRVFLLLATCAFSSSIRKTNFIQTFYIQDKLCVSKRLFADWREKNLADKKMANEKRTTLLSQFFDEILEKSVYYRGVLLMRGFI